MLEKLKSNLPQLIGIIAIITILIIPCCTFLFFSFISYPSTATIARDYLDAVIDKNLEAATNLARSDEECQQFSRETALQDIDQFGGAEIRNTAIEVRNSTGSDDEMQFAVVEFEYRKPGNPKWESGEIRLITDHEVPGFRYMCGKTP